MVPGNRFVGIVRFKMKEWGIEKNYLMESIAICRYKNHQKQDVLDMEKRRNIKMLENICGKI